MKKSLQSFNTDQNLQLWSSRVQKRRNSGKSVKEWCRENDIAPDSFYYWQSKIFHIIAEKQQTNFAEIPVEVVARATPSWMLRSVELYLQPLYEKLRENLLLKDIIHADETPLTVLKPLEKEGASTCWMWLYRTGADAAHPIVLYNYQDGRGKNIPKSS